MAHHCPLKRHLKILDHNGIGFHPYLVEMYSSRQPSIQMDGTDN